jgi:hypothetical protein
VRSRRIAAAITVAAALAVSACGGEAGDLLALEVSGGLQETPLRLTVTEDGRGTCDDGELRPISGTLLIDARDVERDLEPLAEDGASFGSDDRRRNYVALTRAGTVRWVEGGEDLPEVLPRAALLAQALQDELCDI